jgi:hypothetical protein
MKKLKEELRLIVGRPKKRKPRTVEISEQEEGFIQAILAGDELLVAYRKFWTENEYSDAKARYLANQLLKKERIIKRIESIILGRKADTPVDKKFVIDIFKDIAVNQKRTHPSSALSAAIAIGKTLGMFDEKIDDNDAEAHRALSARIWERRQAKLRGEEVKPLQDDKAEETETEVIEFKLKDGTDDS